MRHAGLAALLLALALPTAATAEVVLRAVDPAITTSPVGGLATAAAAAVAVEKVDAPTTVLFVPFYQVDTTDQFGVTTLYAVRNTTTSTIDLEIVYRDVFGATLRQDLVTLGPRATRTRVVRDVTGLGADPDGFARGFIQISTNSPLVGDFFQVDVGEAFATGERLVATADLCNQHEIRFVDFGSGTDLWFLINGPQGDGPADPPSFTARIFDEDGAAFGTVEVFTDQFVLQLKASDFTALEFGTLVFDFTQSGGGWVFGEYSAGGEFSVGLNSACRTP